jgi:hypothetical protein
MTHAVAPKLASMAITMVLDMLGLGCGGEITWQAHEKRPLAGYC